MLLREFNEPRLSCVMAFPDERFQAEIRKIGEQMQADLGDNLLELETDPHVTCLYGLLNDDPAQVKQMLCAWDEPVIANLGPTDKFENDGEDVIFISVESPALTELHRLISRLPNEDTHEDYHPHLTLAYVKPGAGDDWVGRNFGLGEVVFPDLIFSDPDRNQTTLSSLQSCLAGA